MLGGVQKAAHMHSRCNLVDSCILETVVWRLLVLRWPAMLLLLGFMLQLPTSTQIRSVATLLVVRLVAAQLWLLQLILMLFHSWRFGHAQLRARQCWQSAWMA